MRRIRRDDFGSWAEYYAHYQGELARRFLIPFLRENGLTLDGAAILDVGCGDGGSTAALAEVAERCVGLDVGDFRWRGSSNLEFRKGDILDREIADSLAGRFDLVLLRDVIEHIADKPKLMRHVIGAMRGPGHLLVTFPPYYSAFGAHQQVELRDSRLRYVPFVHLHPGLRHLAHTRMTIGGFERLAGRSGMEITVRTLYLLRPSFELRYGLRTIRFGLPWLAGVREIVCTGAYYLLTRSGAGPSEATSPANVATASR